MHFRQVYYFILISVAILINGCQKLVTDPGTDLAGINVSEDGKITWGGDFDDFGYGVFETADGGYAVIGSAYDADYQEDIQLVKFDADLNIENAIPIIYRGTGIDSIYSSVANDIQQTKDGGYVAVGNTFNGSNFDVQVVKFRPNLKVEWQDTISGTYDDFGNSIQQTSDGGYIVFGTKYDGTDEDAILWKFTTTSIAGTITPSYKVLYDAESVTDNNTREFGNYAQETIDGGYVMVSTISTGVNVTKFAPDSTVAFSTDDTGCDEGTIVKQLDDGSYIIIGNIENGIGKQSDVCLNTISTTGVFGTAITMGGPYPDKAHSIIQTSDGGFAFTGSQYNDKRGRDLWIVKLKSNLTTNWSVLYGGDYNDNGASIMQTDDGGYIVAGSSETNLKQSQVLLIKIESDGCIWSNSETLIDCGF